MRGFALWFTGLPGSGKSTLAALVRKELLDRGLDVLLWQMDVRRKVYHPKPDYSDAEREEAYAKFADEVVDLVERGKGVVMDATAHKLAWRKAARLRIPRFAEVHVACPVDTAMAREAARPQGLVMAGLYAKALERKQTGKEFEGLGPVVGVDQPFEQDPEAECVVDNAGPEPALAAASALNCVLEWLKRTAVLR